MKRRPTSDEDHEKAQALIEHLIANPPGPRDPEKGRHLDPNAVSILSNLDGCRRKLAKDRGITYEQWLELEANVRHPRDIVPVTPSPRAIARRRMLAAGVPPRFIEAVADKAPIECEPFKHVRDFLDGHDGFLVLSGGKGTYKTGSASWALGQLDGGTFIEAKHITGIAIEDKARWTAIMSAPLVVLDDLGWEKRDEKGAFTNAFSDLLNTVYSHRRRMIITCNMTKETFAKTYGAREFDRLKEAGKWATIAGQSVRQYDPALHLEREPGEEG